MLIAAPALAQTGETDVPINDNSASDGVTFKVNSSVESRFDTDLEDGGELGVTRFNFGVAVNIPVNEDWSVDVRGGYSFADFDFGGTTGFAALDPWADIHTIEFAAIINYDCCEDWQVFGGPIVQFARESDVDIGDAFTGGAVLGATHVVNDKLLIGGGVGVVSQIENDVRIFPVIIVNWQFQDDWLLTSTTTGSRGGGLEVVYDLCENWDLAIGGAYEFERFRLDDSGIAPDGVGESTGLPLWLRATYKLDKNIELDVFGGLNLGAEVDLYDDRGHRITGDETDSAPLFVGASVRVKF